MPEHIPPDLLDLRQRVHDFMGRELEPLEAETLAPETEAGEIGADLRAEVRRRSREAGIFGMTQPAEFGGTAAGPLALTVAREAVASHNLRLGSWVFGPSPGALGAATGEARTRFLEPLMRGEAAAGFAFTEPSGPEAGKPTWAVRDGDALLVTGRKSYVTNGPFCDFYTVLVNVEAGEGDPAGAPSGPAMVAIEREAPGVTLPRIFSSMDGSRHSEVAFDRVRVPMSYVLGEVGGGMGRALGQIGEMRLAVAAGASGIAMWTVEHVRQHITQPYRQGGTLGDREGVRRIFGELLIEAYAVRAIVYRTARLAESGEDVMNEGAAAKVFATEAVGRIVDQALQLAGGAALTHGHPLERTYRDVRALRIAEGATDILRLNVARGRLEFNAGRV